MCILCKKKVGKLPVTPPSELTKMGIDRDGLSNVYNIKNDLNFCNEVFKNPLFTLEGTTKATSGYTTTACSGVTTASTYTTSGCTAVYNLSEVDDFDLTFNITGNTEYTGYTGNFCYHTFDIQDFIGSEGIVHGQKSKLSNCTPYYKITGHSLNETIVQGDLPQKDAQYILKDFNLFRTQNCDDKFEIDTFNLTSQTVDDMFSEGWYFITVVNPSNPFMNTNIDNSPLGSASLRTEVVDLAEGQTTIFQINGTPLNNRFIVNVNGVQITEGLDYITIPAYVGMFEIVNGELEPFLDTVTVSYINNTANGDDIFNLNEDYLQKDSFIVTGITNDITTSASTRPSINYNPSRERQEILLSSPLKPLADIILTVNGIRLTKNIEYYYSSSDSRKLIMDPKYPINVRDTITAFYLTDDSADMMDLGFYRSLKPTINWGVPEDYVQYRSEDGNFILQITTHDDINFESVIQSHEVEFNQNNRVYSLTLDEMPKDLGKKFLVRVFFFKKFNILFNNVITTRAVSDTASFGINLEYGKNSY